MLIKAGDALEAAFQYWNNKRHWNFLRSTHTFHLIAPFTVTDCTTTADGTGVTAPNLSTVVAGDIVSGTGIRAETYVVSVDTTVTPDAMVLSQPASASGTVTLTFARRDYAAPTNYKFIYNMRDITNGAVVHPIESRLHDRLNPAQLNMGEPLVYDPHPLGADGKFRFLPTPDARHMVEAKYYRRMTVPSTDGTALDIPIDFEWGILAEAKGIFLAEKGGYDALAAYWSEKAKVALQTALKADVNQPDRDYGFLPGYMAGWGTSSGDTIAATDPDAGWGSDWGGNWGS